MLGISKKLPGNLRAATYSSLRSVIERTKAMIGKDCMLIHRVEELKEEINQQILTLLFYYEKRRSDTNDLNVIVIPDR